MKTIRCPQCNLVNWTTIDFCKRCSFDLAAVRVPDESPALAGSFAAPPRGGGDGYQNFAQTPPPPTENYSPNPPNNFSEGSQRQYQEQNNRGGQSGYQQNYEPQNYGRQNYGNGYSHDRNRENYRRSYTDTSKKTAIISLIFGIFSFPMLNMLVCGLLAVILAMGFGNTGGIIGLVTGLVFMPIGLITGIVALRKANRQPDKFGGKGLAIAGIALSGFGLITLPVIAALAIPNLLAARRSANEGAAIAAIRNIAKAENSYLSSMAGKCGDLQTLIAAQMIDPGFITGEKSGYRFALANLPAGGCEINATPLVAEGVSKSGNRSFYASSEENWTIRAADNGGKPADKNDAELGEGFTNSSKKDVSGGKSAPVNNSEKEMPVIKTKPALDEKTPLNPSEQSALANLQEIARAEERFSSDNARGGGGGKTFADVRNLAAKNLLKKELADGVDNGYRFETDLQAGGIEITATPIENVDLNRSFFVGVDRILRGDFKNGAIATKMDRGGNFQTAGN